VKGSAPHLQDDHLFECYLAERTGEGLAPPAAEHLGQCAECAGRFGALRDFMNDLRAHGVAETDDIFPAERLNEQQQQIARRLEHLGHAARVIHFPSRLAGRQPGVSPHATSRWAVAAAGLFVGISAGLVVDQAAGFLRGRPAPAQARAYFTAPTPAPAARLAADDETFLSAVEVAVGGPRNRALAPFEALTPRVQEISARVR
jgi:hypothetical protein